MLLVLDVVVLVVLDVLDVVVRVVLEVVLLVLEVVVLEVVLLVELVVECPLHGLGHVSALLVCGLLLKKVCRFVQHAVEGFS